MRGLKIATSLSLLAGVATLLAWPVIVGPRPDEAAGRRALAEYALRLTGYFGLTCFLFLLTAVLAYLVVRKTRMEYATERLDNLEQLMEGTLRDHGPSASRADDVASD